MFFFSSLAHIWTTDESLAVWIIGKYRRLPLKFTKWYLQSFWFSEGWFVCNLAVKNRTVWSSNFRLWVFCLLLFFEFGNLWLGSRINSKIEEIRGVRLLVSFGFHSLTLWPLTFSTDHDRGDRTSAHYPILPYLSLTPQFTVSFPSNLLQEL